MHATATERIQQAAQTRRQDLSSRSPRKQGCAFFIVCQETKKAPCPLSRLTSHAISTSATVLMFSTEECRRGKYSSMGSRAVVSPSDPAWAKLMPCDNDEVDVVA